MSKDNDKWIREILLDIQEEIETDMRQSVLIEMLEALVEKLTPEDFSMWLAPGQTFKEFIQQQAAKDKD